MAQDWMPLNKKALCSLQSVLEMLSQVLRAGGVSPLSVFPFTVRLIAESRIILLPPALWAYFLVLLKLRLNIPGHSQQFV